MDWKRLVGYWRAILDATARLGGQASDLIVETPATEQDIMAIEAELGTALPASLRNVLLRHARRVNFYWVLPESLSLPQPCKNLRVGGCQWSLRTIADAELLRRYVASAILSTRDDPVHTRGWDDVFAFHQTGFGDLLAVDLRDPARAPVVVLSHDEDRILDGELAEDYQDFLAHWSAIGCPEPEWRFLASFMETAKGPLDPGGRTALEWRKALGLAI